LEKQSIKKHFAFNTCGIAVAYFKNLDLRNCGSGLHNSKLRLRTCVSAFAKISDLQLLAGSD